MEFDADRCHRFIEATTSREARPMLLLALKALDRAGTAVDLGCGAGNDVLHLLEAGWTVLAIDGHDEAIQRTASRAIEVGLDGRLTTMRTTFADLVLKARSYDLIHAGFSLPFTTLETFDRTLVEIGRALRPGGIFAGQFFGPNDDWANDPGRRELTALARAEVESLLSGWTIHHLDEVERDGVTATGTAKHWHVFHIVAERPEAV